MVMDGGAFASSGSPAHCREQNAIANVRRLADACRRRGVLVIHVWFIAAAGRARRHAQRAAVRGAGGAKAMVRGTWGAAPVPGLEAKPGDHVVEKMRMSAWEGTSLETVLKARAATSSSSPAPGPTCRSSTPPAPAPTRATS